MDIFSLIASFGGGVFAAAIGATNAFIMTGFFALFGSTALMMGMAEAGSFIQGTIAFGPFFGPHITFAAGVAAAAYGKKKGYWDNGCLLFDCIGGQVHYDSLLVGGIFGVIGYLAITFLVAPWSGPISPKLVTDNPGIVVFFSGILARLAFGGKLRTGDKVLPEGNALTNDLIFAACTGLLVSGIYVAAAGAGVSATVLGNYPVFCFGIAAIGLIFALVGKAYIGCHHVMLPCALATHMCYTSSGNLGMAFVAGLCFAIIGILLGDLEGNLINSGSDSHIDNPAFAIFLTTFAINAIWG